MPTSEYTTTASRKALSCAEIISEILSSLPLPDVIQRSIQVNRIFQSEAKHTAVSRFASIVRPYVADHVHALVDLLRENRSLIVGSCALKMLLSDEGWEPRNLNILVPRNNVNIFLTFFNSKHYSPTQIPVAPHLVHYASRAFFCEHSSQKPIIITESIDDSVLTPLLASTCTAEFICMTGGGLADIYPHLSSRRIALRSSRTIKEPTSFSKSLMERGFDVKSSSEYMPHDVCPIVWRRINGLRGIWIKDWDASNSVKDIFLGEHHRWCLDTQCLNPECLRSRDI
ncbi:hypothetical protein BJ138DRAFT_1118426 [Hygrophoropsis aurantiaca]|uniref:Uncharacterized protein n=1 Tax=Hygrophoropsis aurantiaca TaxID=72124 RepID=A0ACB7ZYR0_9AGAM|nr:hypothetical protein BJ138DRAFT_1118426 [Hygrophoropsis aurantiaca]